MAIVAPAYPSVDAGRLKLLVVSDYAYCSGGIEHFVCEFLDFAAARFDCRLLTWSISALTPPGFRAIDVVQCGDVRQAWSCMEQADVIMVLTSFNVRMLARLAQEFLQVVRKPAVTVVQTSGHSDAAAGSAATQEAWLTRLMSASRATVAVSEAVAAALARLEPHAPSNVVVIENAARLSASARRTRGRRGVSFIGRPLPQKGFHHFLRLASDLRASGLEFRANTVSIAVSDGPPNIEFSSVLADDRLLEFFSRTDLLVVPYLHADGLPLAVLEAINCGVPIVGFDSPAVAPLLRRHGQVVVPARYEALRDAVRDWVTGALDVPPPQPGCVPAWDEQFQRYVELLVRVGDRADV